MNQRVCIFSLVMLIVGSFTAACGDDGSNNGNLAGVSTLVSSATVDSVDACPNGGVSFDYGLDADGSGELEEAEVQRTLVVCHGLDADADELSELQQEIADLTSQVAALETALAAKIDTNALASVATTGSYIDLADTPVTITDDQVLAIDNLPDFTGWDKNASDDFDGAYTSLTAIPTFATVATTGSYNDLANLPTFTGWDMNVADDFDGAYGSLTGAPALAVVATSGDYADLSNVPDFTGWDTNAADDFDGAYGSLTGAPALAVVATSGDYADLSNVPDFTGWDTNAADDFDGAYGSLTGAPALAVVATSGDYADLSNAPDFTGWDTNAADDFDGAYGSLTGAPALAVVATSGDYADLSNVPDFTGWDTNAADDFDGAYGSLTGTPALAGVATSGSYNDLADLPDFTDWDQDIDDDIEVIDVAGVDNAVLEPVLFVDYDDSSTNACGSGPCLQSFLPQQTGTLTSIYTTVWEPSHSSCTVTVYDEDCIAAGACITAPIATASGVGEVVTPGTVSLVEFVFDNPAVVFDDTTYTYAVDNCFSYVRINSTYPDGANWGSINPGFDKDIPFRTIINGLLPVTTY